jgi:hypothetical protein
MCLLQGQLLGTSCSLSQQQAALQHSKHPQAQQQQGRQLLQFSQD